ncbi:unnamed protein product [Caenorhabditis angaria]|uniref:Uncharacterized protein n=1 Tax=Caenorhabditis angaria TaxID=860376 RepID=A0A9P1J1G7_9PELO|nr:unnamed protein product [Caenorhabditis angaria]
MDRQILPPSDENVAPMNVRKRTKREAGIDTEPPVLNRKASTNNRRRKNKVRRTKTDRKGTSSAKKSTSASRNLFLSRLSESAQNPVVKKRRIEANLETTTTFDNDTDRLMNDNINKFGRLTLQSAPKKQSNEEEKMDDK